MKRLRTHYDNLQVSENASQEVIRGAYKFLSQKWHPDKNPGERAKAERITRIINDAYAVLSDPERRREHDRWIADQRRARAFDVTLAVAPGGGEARTFSYGRTEGLQPMMAGRGQRFVNLRDGTVLDTGTALHWMTYSVGEGWENGRFTGQPEFYDAGRAQAAAERFNARYGCGQDTPWRLPSKRELRSLYQRSMVPFKRVLDESVFSADYSAPYWTRTDNPWLQDDRPRLITLHGDPPPGGGDRPLGRVRLVRGPDPVMLAEAVHQVARGLLREKEREAALKVLTDGLARVRETRGMEDRNVVLWLRDLARVHFQGNEYDQAEWWLKEMVREARGRFGPAHREVFDCLMDLGYFYKTTQNYLLARDTFMEGYELLGSLDEDEDGLLSVLLHDLVVLLLMHRQYTRAEEVIQAHLKDLLADREGAWPARAGMLVLVLGLLKERGGQTGGSRDLFTTFLNALPPPVAGAEDFRRPGP
ncbi:MAG: DnaJ domain-containing protein [Ectothiorhodospira sp.]